MKKLRWSNLTISGFKLSEKPADKDHPYGHGRIEYISGLLISIIVIIIGLQFIKSSVLRILNPSSVTTDEIVSKMLLTASAMMAME